MLTATRTFSSHSDRCWCVCQGGLRTQIKCPCPQLDIKIVRAPSVGLSDHFLLQAVYKNPLLPWIISSHVVKECVFAQGLHIPAE